jgi:hypothetical protein
MKGRKPEVKGAKEKVVTRSSDEDNAEGIAPDGGPEIELPSERLTSWTVATLPLINLSTLRGFDSGVLPTTREPPCSDKTDQGSSRLARSHNLTAAYPPDELDGKALMQLECW